MYKHHHPPLRPSAATADEEPSPLSPKACDKCTRSKRKCDKVLPGCGRCTRLRVECVYAHDAAVTDSKSSNNGSPNSDTVIKKQPARVGPELSGFAQHEDIQVKRILLASTNIDWRESVVQYFSTVHSWFSILRAEPFHHVIIQPPSQNPGSRNDWIAALPSDASALLVTCMYLLTKPAHLSISEDDIFCPFYRMAKRRFTSLSCLSAPTLELMQCGAMVALFEFGHGRPTFAYRTLGETSAMIRVAPFSQGPPSSGNGSSDLGTEDDRLSVWWGLFILDQYIHLDPTTKDLPLLLEGPHDDDLLPTQSVLWDGSAYQPYNQALPISVDLSTHLGTFQRSAQAAMALHAVLNWESNTFKNGNLAPISDIANLDKRIRDLLHAMLHQCNEWEVFCDAFAASLSAMFILYRPYLQHNAGRDEARSVEERPQAAAAIKFAVQFINDLAVSFNSHLQQRPEWLSNLAPPATIPCFQAAEYIVLFNDVLSEFNPGFFDIYKALKTFSRRWKVGDNMLAVMAHHKYMADWISEAESRIGAS